ncbi:DNA-formamidopyrimidine glycosylase family protein [Williamsia sp. CHRR-6]|uniref:DNA-formamidopyrimidine glycosylase family protein n=1 Tax=Williamsia sp. CHRR-6 TaxID=2835871 RepID=UPI001BDA63CD|nr:DNA-formamidopyrimidine glycosylase family protein [Williamsia sp. CHRR-6]MBT0566854.1 DNA glycosylase [Williamsia sp. CHRR-6]
MPEGDTVYQAAARVRAAFAGKPLAYSQFRVPRYATVDLVGRTVESVRSIGKHHLIDVGDDWAIHTHLKMEGAWVVHPIGTRWRKPAFTARIVLRTDTHEAVGFDMGICEMLRHPDEALAYLGPDLLSPDFDRDLAVANLARDPSRPIGLALLDQHLMAGVGNVYRCESCFLRGVDPHTPVGEVDLDAIVDLCQRMLLANRDRTRSTTGNPTFAQRYWVYGRGGRPCRRCRTPITREFLGEDAARARGSEDRVLYRCRRCQT